VKGMRKCYTKLCSINTVQSMARSSLQVGCCMLVGGADYHQVCLCALAIAAASMPTVQLNCSQAHMQVEG